MLLGERSGMLRVEYTLTTHPHFLIMELNLSNKDVPSFVVVCGIISFIVINSNSFMDLSCYLFILQTIHLVEFFSVSFLAFLNEAHFLFRFYLLVNNSLHKHIINFHLLAEVEHNFRDFVSIQIHYVYMEPFPKWVLVPISTVIQLLFQLLV